MDWRRSEGEAKSKTGLILTWILEEPELEEEDAPGNPFATVLVALATYPLEAFRAKSLNHLFDPA
jgi:hypothetical protein